MAGKTTRVRTDGFVWCPRCQRFLPPDRFGPSVHGCGFDAYCRPCRSGKTRDYTIRRALSDPAWYTRRLTRENSNQRRNARRRQIQRELHQLFDAAYARLKEQGLSDRAIAERAGITKDTIRIWRSGRGYRHTVAEKMIAVAFPQVAGL